MGVPQGLILRPIILKYNNLTNNLIYAVFEVKRFVDNTSLFSVIRDSNALTNDLEKIHS